MAQTQHRIQEAPELAALGSPDVASGDLPIGLRALIDAGVHFGHQTKRWNPRMRPYIYGARNGIHIIDLDQTAQLFKKAYQFVSDAVARGGHVLFVGTKRQAADIIYEEAGPREPVLRHRPLARRHPHQLPHRQVRASSVFVSSSVWKRTAPSRRW